MSGASPPTATARTRIDAHTSTDVQTCTDTHGYRRTHSPAQPCARDCSKGSRSRVCFQAGGFQVAQGDPLPCPLFCAEGTWALGGLTLPFASSTPCRFWLGPPAAPPGHQTLSHPARLPPLPVFPNCGTSSRARSDIPVVPSPARPQWWGTPGPGPLRWVWLRHFGVSAAPSLGLCKDQTLSTRTSKGSGPRKPQSQTTGEPSLGLNFMD